MPDLSATNPMRPISSTLNVDRLSSPTTLLRFFVPSAEMEDEDRSTCLRVRITRSEKTKTWTIFSFALLFTRLDTDRVDKIDSVEKMDAGAVGLEGNDGGGGDDDGDFWVERCVRCVESEPEDDDE